MIKGLGLAITEFNISRFNEGRQRERDFVAAKTFLPSTLRDALIYSWTDGLK